MTNYRELDIFNVSKKLAIEVHKVTLTLPKFELYEEGNQIRRSAKAVTSLIVEGYGRRRRRRYKADFIKYLVYAHAECDETIVHFEFLYETESLKDDEKFSQLVADYIFLSKKINKFILWVEEN